MCKGCVKAVKKYFPDVPSAEYGDFLMSVTAFPMGNQKTVRTQLKELRMKTANYRECYSIAEDYLLAHFRLAPPRPHKHKRKVK